MGDISISCPRATLICHHEAEEDTKISLEKVHISGKVASEIHTDMKGRTRAVAVGLPRLTITGDAPNGDPVPIDPKHPPKPASFVPGRKRRKKESAVPLSKRLPIRGSF